MSTEFDKIKDYAGWEAKLKQLLAAAEKVSGKNDADGALTLATRLNEFVLASSPNTPEILALDELATTAARELSLTVVGEAVERISARTAALRSIAKQLDVVSSRAEAAAGAIRLERAHRVVDALTEAVRAVDDLDGVLKDGSDEELRKRLTRLADAMRSLRNDVDDALGRRS